MMDAPGWDAIDMALRDRYGSVAPLHYAPEVPSRLGGDQPLDGISGYQRGDPVPHWHLVSYGMSELYGKESEDPTKSGWGFELTFRVARGPDDPPAPPDWSLRLMQRLAGYVFDTARPFAPGHTLDPKGPLTGPGSTSLSAVAFTADPELEPVDTPHGQLSFLQIVGLTRDEYQAARQWQTAALLDVLRRRAALLVTDPTRPSILDDHVLASEVREGIRRDGSSTGEVASEAVDWSVRNDGVTIELEGELRPVLARMIAARLGFDRPLRVRSPFGMIELRTDVRFAATEADHLELTIPRTTVADLVAAVAADGEQVIATTPPLRVRSMRLGP